MHKGLYYKLLRALYILRRNTRHHIDYIRLVWPMRARMLVSRLCITPTRGVATLDAMIESAMIRLVFPHEVITITSPDANAISVLRQNAADADEYTRSFVMDPQAPRLPLRFEKIDTAGAVTYRISAESMSIVVTYPRIAVYNAAGELVLEERTSAATATGLFRRRRGRLYGIHGFDAWQGSAKGLKRDGGGIARAGDQGSCGAPLVWSPAGYAILVDAEEAVFAASARGLAAKSLTPARASFERVFITGSVPEIFRAVHAATGAAPLFPRWSAGFINTEWGIDQKELMEIIAGYAERSLPLDAFILDFDWCDWGGGPYGEWRWHEGRFPGGADGSLAASLAASGVALGGIIKPRIHADTEQGRYAAVHGYFWQEQKPYRDYFSKKSVRDLDFRNPGARAWFWSHFRNVFRSGLTGFWNDEADEGFPAAQFHFLQKALYDGQRGESERRVWSLNRNFYLGSQRHAYGIWSGDISSGFAPMRRQRERMLAAINCGAMRWSMDTGGFHGTPTDENYARWMQFAAFTPVFRVHGTLNEQRQPWAFGPDAERAASDMIRLRRMLRPYIYAHEPLYRETGAYLVRPFCWTDPRRVFANYIDGWHFGAAFAVYPVMRAGARSMRVLLPQGEWISWRDGTVHSGAIRYAIAGTGDVPLFVRRGSIVPIFENGRMVIEVYPGADASFDRYDDDGESYAYERGDCFRQTIALAQVNETVTVRFDAPRGSYCPADERLLLRVYGAISADDTVLTRGHSSRGEYGEQEIPGGVGVYRYSITNR